MRNIFNLTIFSLAIIALFVGGMGCAVISENFEWYEDDEIMIKPWENQRNMVSGHSYATTSNNVQPTMHPDDMEYLEDTCAQCHTLDRVFMVRGPRRTWESLLNQSQHQEAGFEQEEINRLFDIFQRYLS